MNRVNNNLYMEFGEAISFSNTHKYNLLLKKMKTGHNEISEDEL